MTNPPKLFFSCVESRIEEQGSMYARFHMGTFFRGQALTFANALRRTLLSELPGLVLTDVKIEGASHEFATLPGVEESVREILLNLQSLVFRVGSAPVSGLEGFQAQGHVRGHGPGTVTAGDLKLPPSLQCVTPSLPLATLTTGGELSLTLFLAFRRPSDSESDDSPRHLMHCPPIPMPVHKVNYLIKEANSKSTTDYVVFEVWTNGSLTPQESVLYALRHLTNLFYQFTELSLPREVTQSP